MILAKIHIEYVVHAQQPLLAKAMERIILKIHDEVFYNLCVKLFILTADFVTLFQCASYG